MKRFLFILILSIPLLSNAQNFSNKVIVGAEQTNEYLKLLTGKRVGLLVNQTSMIKKTHLVDSLKSRGVDIKTIFAPEHGFRGKADAGAHVANGRDIKTGLPIISLYGKNKKPTASQLSNIDIVVFDIQDVGARFYTYISTLEYMMEACAEQGKEMLILDRPNPNGFYVDGPVLNKNFKSFVGMQSIPIVHGMTVAEYALMLNGESWLKNKAHCTLRIITCEQYTHKTLYRLPVAPSPNLRSPSAILLYPSLCLFEGTEVSVGRGTKHPFEVWGNPNYRDNGFSFTPISSFGSANPKYKNQKCYGANLQLPPYDVLKILKGQFNLDFLKKAYSSSKHTTKFFTPFFNKLAGNSTLKQQILDKKSEAEIRASWEPNLTKFKTIRKKYLLYEDFE